MKKLSLGKKWFIAMSALAILSFISFSQVNSYWADKHHFNGFFGWIGVGIVTALGALYSLRKVLRNTNN